MSNWGYKEITLWSRWAISQFAGAQLQDIWTDGEVLVFELYKFQSFWICLDLKMQAPALAALRTRPPFKKKPKPVTLFLNSHAKNLRLEGLRSEASLGRYLEINFVSPEKTCRIEFIMIPRKVNLIVHAEGKQISLQRPQDLPPSKWVQEEPGDEEVDGWILGEQWLEQRSQRSSAQIVDVGAQLHRDLEKKQKALATLVEQSPAKDFDRWKLFGEKLKENIAHQIVPKDFEDLYDQKVSYRQNMENAFAQAKKIKAKQEGALDRISKLKSEILELEQKIVNFQSNPDSLVTEKPLSRGQKISQDKSIKTQRIPLDGFELMIGKSGKDNLALLRQAQAWDYWVHLKDEPGAHGILVRPRNREVPIAVIEQAAQRVMKASKSKSFAGKYEVIVVECRYVKPIKGDRLGRVTYHNPRVYTFASKG